MLESKFKSRSYIPLIISFGLLLILYLSIISLTDNIPIWGHVLIAVCVVFLGWIIFMELSDKVVSISIDSDSITSVKLLGWGRKTTIQLKDIDGYRTSSVPAEWDTTEVLYLIVKNKKVFRLSEFYHLNYVELKNVLVRRLKNLGHERYRLFK